MDNRLVYQTSNFSGGNVPITDLNIESTTTMYWYIENTGATVATTSMLTPILVNPGCFGYYSDSSSVCGGHGRCLSPDSKSIQFFRFLKHE